MPNSGAADIVRARVALADRLRRRRDANHSLWRAAPTAAAACAAAAGAARWIGWSPLLPLAALTLGTATLAAYVYVARRDRAISDGIAAEIDDAARMSGELRSASWFAGRDGADPWVDLHLARAADKLQAIDWNGLYPPVRAPRAKLTSAIMVLAALLAVFLVPGGRGLHLSASAVTAAVTRPDRTAASMNLPEDLLKALNELLKTAEQGGTARTGTALTAGEIRDLLARLARSRDAAAVKARDEKRDGADGLSAGPTRKELEAAADRAKRASEMTSLSPEVRDALSDAADKLQEMSEAQQAALKDAKDAAGAGESQQEGPAGQTNGDGARQDASVQSVKDASSGGGAAVVMMANDDPGSAKEAGLGLGGSSARNNGGGRMPELDAALRKETIEAHEDAPGENLPTDIRRKTEKATATVAYVSSTPAAIERGRATAPPAVPESRRAAVQSYFIRKQ